MQFADRTVLVTGGGSGIGAVMAARFAAERAAVVIAERNGDKGAEVAGKIAAAGGKVIAIQTDVSVSQDVQGMVARAEKAFGPVDVLVNNAAAVQGDNVASMDETTWDLDVTVCLKSAFLCCRYVLPSMIARKRGVIVNIASVNALGFFGNEAYSAAKAGVINLTESIAARYGRHGIRANAIAPGSIRTPVWQHRIDKDPHVLKRLEKWYPLGRIGEPDDVANAALFLASDAASWISGIVLRVDGGLMAGNPLMADDLLVESR
jgi:NAD(P)-dependent dehydrogenase (short-subunit alcohol dehydrogenase family)